MDLQTRFFSLALTFSSSYFVFFSKKREEKRREEGVGEGKEQEEWGSVRLEALSYSSCQPRTQNSLDPHVGKEQSMTSLFIHI
jgi:hypothetical protein